MFIKEDYSYISYLENKLIEKGYGKLSVHSIHFDRYFTEEQQEKNRQLAQSVTTEEWNKHCDVFGEHLNKQLMEIAEMFNSKYNLHQFDTENSTIEHYRTDWDLHFYSNKGWNGKDYMDFFSLTFNDERTPKENISLLEEIREILKALSYENVMCRIQYDAIIDDKRVEKEAKEICESLLGKFIVYNGMIGKIKVIHELEDKKEYGFFKKKAKSNYYPIHYANILMMKGV